MGTEQASHPSNIVCWIWLWIWLELILLCYDLILLHLFNPNKILVLAREYHKIYPFQHSIWIYHPNMIYDNQCLFWYTPDKEYENGGSFWFTLRVPYETGHSIFCGTFGCSPYWYWILNFCLFSQHPSSQWHKEVHSHSTIRIELWPHQHAKSSQL
jgi:hypothetical protein